MVQAQQGQIAQQQQAEIEHARQTAIVEESRKLHELIPNWSDPVEQPKIAGQNQNVWFRSGLQQRRD